jgi:predicted RNase H-like nuclease (RuvC/YqgF family)
MQKEIGEDTPEKILDQWLEFMLERVGHNNLPLLLYHYEDIGWISKNVTVKLIERAESQKQRYVGPSWTLSAEEHRISMHFIEKLQGKNVEIPVISAHDQIKEKPQQIERTAPREGYLESHRIEKEELDIAVHRRDVTIRNLEAELEKKDVEISKLKEIMQELEYKLNESMDEVKKLRIYRGVLEENINLKKIDFFRR